MKTMTLFEARNHFSRTLRAAEKDVVVVTRRGKPVAAIHAIDDDDLADLLLERSDAFWEMIARARQGRGISLDSYRHKMAKKGRRKRAKGRAP